MKKVCRGRYWNRLKGFEECPRRDNCALYAPKEWANACINLSGEDKKARIIVHPYVRNFRQCRPVKKQAL